MASLTDFTLYTEMAMRDTPRTTTPWYTDISSKVRIASGISLRRGRSNEYDASAQPGTASCTLLNPAGDFTMGYWLSEYAPLQLRRPLRFRCRYGTAAGNLLSAEDASFEGGTTGTWDIYLPLIGFTNAVSIANSATRAQHGTKSLLVTWATSAASCAGLNPPTINPASSLGNLVAGRQYTASAYVYVPAGSPPVTIQYGLFPTGSTASAAAWTRISVTFTADTPWAYGCLAFTSTSTGAGQQAWIDAVQIDEGPSVRTFTTSPPPIYELWQGFVDAWGNGRDQLLGVANIRASDRIARAAATKLRAQILAEMDYDNPAAIYALGEAAGATTAGDTSQSGGPTLTTVQLGSGGSLAFGVGAAPGPDAGTVAAFTRSDATNGVYLQSPYGTTFSHSEQGSWMAAMVRPSTSSAQMTAAHEWAGFTDQWSYVSLGVSSSGKARARFYGIYVGLDVTITGSTTLPLTSFTHIAVTQSKSVAGTVTVKLFVNGTQEASTTYSLSGCVGASALNIGGYSGGDLWDGQIAYVAAGPTELVWTRLQQQALGRSGWVGETSNLRFSRLCRFAGLPTSHYATTGTGLSTMAAQPAGGLPLLDALKAVAEAENGVVYVRPTGVLTFAIRSARYAADVGLTLDSRKPGQLATGFELDTDDALLVNDYTVTRPAGAVQRVVDNTSVTNYDTHDDSATLYLTSDSDAFSAAQWRVFTSSSPQPRSGTIEVDVVAYATSGGNVAQLLAADIGTHLQVTNLPIDVAPTGTVDLFIEGVAPTITKDAFTLTFTVSPMGASGSVMVLDDAVFGALDTGGVLAY